MSYEDVASFAQTWGLVIFVAVFVVIVAYAVWPKNKKRFDEAARIPLEEDRKTNSDRKNGRDQE